MGRLKTMLKKTKIYNIHTQNLTIYEFFQTESLTKMSRLAGEANDIERRKTQ